jgi:hypothetical protein
MVLTGFGAEKMRIMVLSKHPFIVLLASGKRTPKKLFLMQKSS